MSKRFEAAVVTCDTCATCGVPAAASSRTLRATSRPWRTRRGFSLIELLLVLVILAVLAAVVVPKFTNRSEQARKTAARTDIAMLETALDAYEIDNGRFPTTDEGLEALVVQKGNVQNWQGPYIKRGVPVDPWGNEYIYRYPGVNNSNGYDMSSLGPDGREGGDDITNWSNQ